MSTVPRLTYRFSHLVELVTPQTADVVAYRFGAANTLDVAFAGTTAMFTLASGSAYRSKSLRKAGRGLSVYTTRKLTQVSYDPEDYWAPGGTLPHDANASYLRVEEQDAAGTFRPAGPILIIPPPNFFTTTRPNLIVAGTAPNVAASSIGVPPEGAMHFVLPRFADSVSIANTGLQNLLVSFNPGLPEFTILNGQTFTLPDAAVSDVFVRGNGATVTFTMSFAIVNAEMA